MNYRRMIFAGALTVLSVAAASGAASARTLTGYGAFSPWPNAGAQDCVSESWGAALSNCSTPQTLVFEAPVDNGGAHTINAWSYGDGYGSFSCNAQSIVGEGGPWGWWGATDTFNPSGKQMRSFSVDVGGGASLRLVCWDVPNNRGVASINFNP
ncbi:hypothetical protein WME95_47170 [Sorangium sp. So ce327]|uniref:hypothetical protein n=1 Tax=Sorangium sp. So ce327 TaxID=3133301 RepID=UPI003F62E2CD